jgi:hypothetical protein
MAAIRSPISGPPRAGWDIAVIGEVTDRDFWLAINRKLTPNL